MFQKIGRSLALQFTGFVFLLILMNGVVFLIVDFGNEVRQTHDRLMTEMEEVQAWLPDMLSGIEDVPHTSHPERLRIIDEHGMPVFIGELFRDLPIEIDAGFSVWMIGNEDFVVLSTPIMDNGKESGMVHIAQPEHAFTRNVAFRSLLYFLVSILISFFTFLVGKHFVRKSLKPAEDMLERLEQFTQDASHELRTPLAVLGSSLDLALKAKTYEMGIVSAKEDLRQISGLVERLLETARSGNVQLHRCDIDLSLLIQESTKKIKVLADAKSITIKKNILDGIRVEGDAILIGQVFSNILSNAVKFSREGGEVIVTLREESFSVTDRGIGINAHDLRNIFERFYQADSSRTHEGYGLGLSFVKKIIERHGWKITVESEPEKGSTFTVFFGTEKHRIS